MRRHTVRGRREEEGKKKQIDRLRRRSGERSKRRTRLGNYSAGASRCTARGSGFMSEVHLFVGRISGSFDVRRSGGLYWSMGG